jgi:hypothetical protein
LGWPYLYWGDAVSGSSAETHLAGASSPWLTTDGEHEAIEVARAVRLDRLDDFGRRDAPTPARAGQDPLAVLLHDLVIHDNQRWWGRAAIQLDTVVLTGAIPHEPNDSSGLLARTFRFPRVADGQELSPDGGLLLFYGVPRFFLEIFVLASRAGSESADLESLLNSAAGPTEVANWVAATQSVAMGEPTVQAVSALASAAFAVGSAAYKILRERTDATIGVYRGVWLQARDAFGVGMHPGEGQMFHEQDISFWYEVRRELGVGTDVLDQTR